VTELLFGCSTCARPLEHRPGPGRPRRYCSAACRQRAYVERLRRAAEPELAAARTDLAAVRDELAELDGVVEDLRRDEVLRRSDVEVREALQLLLAAIPRRRR